MKFLIVFLMLITQSICTFADENFADHRFSDIRPRILDFVKVLIEDKIKIESLGIDLNNLRTINAGDETRGDFYQYLLIVDTEINGRVGKLVLIYNFNGKTKADPIKVFAYDFSTGHNYDFSGGYQLIK
jgi:hypothetical protein